MACKKQTVPFAGTPEQEAQLKAVIAELKDQPGSLMPVMQKAQDTLAINFNMGCIEMQYG